MDHQHILTIFIMQKRRIALIVRIVGTFHERDSNSKTRAVSFHWYRVFFLLGNTFFRWKNVLDVMDSENPFEVLVPDTCASKWIINDYGDHLVRHGVARLVLSQYFKIVGLFWHIFAIVVNFQYVFLLESMLECI